MDRSLPCQQIVYRLMELARSAGNQDLHVATAEWYLDEADPPPDMSPLAKAWQDLIGEPFIPFDKAEREQRFPRAFEVLRASLQDWQR